jgi:hypothetical protein
MAKESKILNSGAPMNQNLDVLRQSFCRPAVVADKETSDLFPLEKGCEQGKALLAKAPKRQFYLQEFSPYGLHQTYRDEASGLDLPVFSVFDLEGKNQAAFEITTDSITPVAEAKSLPSYLPWTATQSSVRQINESRTRQERGLVRISLIFGIFPALAYFFSGNPTLPGFAEAGILVGGWATGAFLIQLLGLLVLDRIRPWKKLILTGEFDGLLPKETRQKARIAQHYFDHLYVIIDQQHRWKSTFLPDPKPRALDPLLVGEQAKGRSRKFFLIDQFDLTEAEQYLADEFAFKTEEALATDSRGDS